MDIQTIKDDLRRHQFAWLVQLRNELAPLDDFMKMEYGELHMLQPGAISKEEEQILTEAGFFLEEAVKRLNSIKVP